MSNAFMFYRCGGCADEKVIPLQWDRKTIIGRAEETDFSLLSPYVSRTHVQVWRDDDFWFIKDLGSVNGTYILIDDQVHLLDPHKPYPLLEGSVVALGVNPAVWVTKQTYKDDPEFHVYQFIRSAIDNVAVNGLCEAFSTQVGM